MGGAGPGAIIGTAPEMESRTGPRGAGLKSGMIVLGIETTCDETAAGLIGVTPFPYILFLASGGHTQIVAVRGVGDYVRLGTTADDAIGEAFDKTAKLLGLGYPGGPLVEKEALAGNPARFALPRPMQ